MYIYAFICTMNKVIAKRRRSFAIVFSAAFLTLWHFLHTINNNAMMPSSSHQNVAVVAPTTDAAGPLSCQDVSGISIDVPGVTISNHTLVSSYTSTNSNWGNTLSPYWAARVYAELGGYRFSGIPLGKENEWMRNLPTSAESKPARREALKSFCICRRQRHKTWKQYKFFHSCNYGWLVLILFLNSQFLLLDFNLFFVVSFSSSKGVKYTKQYVMIQDRLLTRT
mmetsp:Transcript_30508/g.60948  ORF Transcript_30508/g.60948 Transcript_30508/m.60948 type:complete len:224 (-) Transcript_30508:872-1543(-)